MGYPTNKSDRAAFWGRHIKQSTKQLEPWYRVGRRILSLYENVAYTQRERAVDSFTLTEENTSRVKPSLTYAWIEQSMANMLSRLPRFRVQAMRRDSMAGEVPVGKVVNHWYKVTDQMHQDRLCLQDAFTWGFAIKKVGWTANVVEDGAESINDDAELSFDDAEEENLFLATGEPARVDKDHDHIDHIAKHRKLLDDVTISDEVKDDIIQPHISDHEERLEEGMADVHVDIQEEQPFGIRWYPEDFRIDPLARDGIKDARWIAFKTVRPLDEIMDNPNYDRAAVNKLRGERLTEAPDIDPRFGEDDGFGMVTVWEVWARNFKISGRKRRNIIAVYAEQGDDNGGPILLRHEDEWPYESLNGYPAQLLKFGQGTKTWLQKPILALAGFDNIQLLMNEVLDSFLGVVRKQKNIIFYDSDIFQNNEVELALTAADGAAIGVPGLSNQPGATQPLPFLTIPNDKGAFLDLIQGLGDRAAGTPQPLDSGSDTATESAIKERRTSAREGIRLDAFEQFQVETAEAFWALHTQFQPKIEFQIDPKAGEWSEVDKEVVKGRYRFEVDVSSAANTQALERKQWLDLLNLFSGLIEVAQVSGQPPPNLPAIAEQLLVRGFDVLSPEDLWPAIEGELGPENQLAQALQAQMGQGQPGQGQEPGSINRQQFGQGAPSEAAQMGEAVSL